MVVYEFGGGVAHFKDGVASCLHSPRCQQASQLYPCTIMVCHATVHRDLKRLRLKHENPVTISLQASSAGDHAYSFA